MRTLQDALCTADAVRQLKDRGVKLDADMQDQLSLADEIARLKKVVMACWGALSELSPCMHGECKQAQTEALDLALRMAEDIVRPNEPS